MDATEKLLRKITKAERAVLLEIAEALQSLEGRKKLNVTKIVGTDFLRAKKGKFRIIFHFEKDDAVIDSIRMRNEKTYKNI